MTIKYGKAKLRLVSVGCIDCGAEHAEKWIVAKKITILVGVKKFEAVVQRCAACQDGRSS